MLDFLSYIESTFLSTTHWNIDNSYPSLTLTARSLLDFPTPLGLRLSVSSLSTPHFAASYNVGSIGVVDGSISYLYSSTPLWEKSGSGEIGLKDVVGGYRGVRELKRPEEDWWWELWKRGKRVDRRDTLLYGRMYLPRSALEALYLRRLSPTRQLRISAVSDNSLNNGGTILTLLQNDYGKYSTEYLYSTDSALLGVRGLYNFGPDPRKDEDQSSTSKIAANALAEAVNGRFSAGAELYYGLLNKSGGMSTGLRFTTLPQHTGFPYTMTLTLNPLMGNLSSTYSVKAGRNLALCSRFNFNFYSYESDLQLGMELWRREQPQSISEEIAWAVEKMKPGWSKQDKKDEDVTGILKARVDQDWKIGLLWEGRIKELLFTLGASFDMKRREHILGAVGIELQYSS